MIRLLDILPGVRRNAIRVSLRVAALTSGLQYEALSYCWGESHEHRSIIVQEKYRMAVTDNLYNALLHMRRRYRRCTIWIDQLCINQADIDERSSQVARMGSIYSTASRVNVWLGLADYPQHAILSTLTKLRAFVLSSVDTFWDDKSWKFLWYDLSLAVLNVNACIAFLDACRNIPSVVERAISSTTPCWLDRAWVL